MHEQLIMRVRGYHWYKRAFFAACAFLLLVNAAQPACADSFAGLNLFGFPATDGAMSGLSGGTSSNGMLSTDGALSASAVSLSPSNQYTGFFGTGLGGMQLGVNFAYPVASHDASNVAFARTIAFESLFGDDAIAFPDAGAALGTTWSSFPTISSTNGDVKFMDSVQLQLSTVSDTMPMPITGFGYPSGFFNGFFL